MANYKPNISGLKPFKPGQSGNPKGKPKGAISFSTRLKSALQQVVETKADGSTITLEDVLVNRIIKRAIEHDSERMMELIWAYYDGKPAQRTIHEGPDAGPVQHEVWQRSLKKVYGKKAA